MYCSNCNDRLEGVAYEQLGNGGEILCESCCQELLASGALYECEQCHHVFDDFNDEVFDGVSMCPTCYVLYVRECDECSSEFWRHNLCYTEGQMLCPGCLDDHYPICESCGDRTPVDESYHEDDSLYCEGCHDRLYSICHDCESSIRIDHAYMSDGRMYCRSCFYESFFYCDSCGEPTPHDMSCSTDNGEGSYCQDCFTDNFSHCDRCHNSMSNSDSVHITDVDEYWCPRCTNNYAYTCDECGTYCSELVYQDEDDDAGICTECQSCSLDSWHGPTTTRPMPSSIQPYDFKPRPYYFGSAPYYGVELETDRYNDRYSAAQGVHRIDNTRLYFKADGSLENGIEIVSHPMDVDEWIGFEDKLKKIQQIVVREGGRSHETTTCGIHVHRSKADLSQIDQCKLITFFAINKDKIVQVARRESSGYASFDSFDGLSRRNRYEKVLAHRFIKDSRHSDKYLAINFRHQNTLEFRIFKGSLVPSTILASIGFCHYVTMYCKSMLFQQLKLMGKQSFQDFVNMVKTKAHTEKLADNLLKYLQKRRIIPKPKKYSPPIMIVADNNESEPEWMERELFSYLPTNNRGEE